jgi:hypothetical protein
MTRTTQDVPLPPDGPVEPKHHRRETERIDSRSACYSGCGRPAGSPGYFSGSAWCLDDQVYDFRPVPSGSCGCARCLQLFGTVTLFDLHLAVDYTAPDPVTCLDPSTLDGEPLVQVNGVWLTEAGHRKRAQAAINVRAAQEARRPAPREP